jgi:putative transposase
MMPRAHRYFLPGLIWHITHRCHDKSFLLRFAHDRRRYRDWLFEAKKRLGLCVLDYVVTCNHVHLLVKDTGGRAVARSMQLVAGRVAQEFNQRKQRRGAFWEDRYHATAVSADEHLRRCLVYIDLNMVRAGVVSHPMEWINGGYRELQHPPHRYRLIDLPELSSLCGFARVADFQRAHKRWIEESLRQDVMARDDRWTRAVAVGNATFVEAVKRGLEFRARYREIVAGATSHELRELHVAYR